MALSPETLYEIDIQVRGGFKDRERIIEIFREEMYAPGELDPAEVEVAVDKAIGHHEDSKRTWPEMTDCDRLDNAFNAIRRRGVIALQNAGLTQSDGYEDFRDEYDSRDDRSHILGYCFFHEQDLERAIAGEGLYLVFGPVDEREEQSRGSEIGHVVAEELRNAGFEVQWNGTFDQRILLPHFDWKKR